MTEDAIARILIDELEAGPAHAAIVAREIAALFSAPAPARVAKPEDGPPRCGACGAALPEFGGIAFDDERNEVRFRGKVARNFTGQEGALLRALLDAKGRAVTKENLLATIYARRFYADDELPDIKIIDVFACKLRKKLAALGLEVGTIWGKGYHMKAPEGTP